MTPSVKRLSRCYPGGGEVDVTYSGRDCVKSLGSSYTGWYSQRGGEGAPSWSWVAGTVLPPRSSMTTSLSFVGSNQSLSLDVKLQGYLATFLIIGVHISYERCTHFS